MFISLFLDLLHFTVRLENGLPVISVHLSAFPFDLFGKLLVNFGFAVGLALSFTFLSHKHLPPAHIIHRFVLMRQ